MAVWRFLGKGAEFRDHRRLRRGPRTCAGWRIRQHLRVPKPEKGPGVALVFKTREGGLGVISPTPICYPAWVTERKWRRPRGRRPSEVSARTPCPGSNPDHRRGRHPDRHRHHGRDHCSGRSRLRKTFW